jgi:hypothetical protein
MSAELLLLAPCPSPHALWLSQHGLMLKEYQHLHSLNKAGDRWVCANRAQTRYASADTEDAAEQAYCERYGLQWWKLAEWNEAMAGDGVSAVLPDNPGEEMAFG